jgi:hypothetical protein
VDGTFAAVILQEKVTITVSLVEVFNGSLINVRYLSINGAL